MTMIMIACVLTGFIVGMGLSFIVKPRRDPDPKVRELLDEYASAVTMAQVNYDLDNPNILNEETRKTFQALKNRYIKELIK
jgi:hypothetical protein